MTTNHIIAIPRVLLAGLLAVALTSCGSQEKAPEASKPSGIAGKPDIHVPPPTEHYDGTPFWLIQSKNWPTLLEWTFGPDGEYTQDSLNVRLSGTVIQSFVSGPKSKDHPIMCWYELTVRPLPRRLIGYALNIDSVVFYDPVKKITLPSLPMLSSERHTEKGVVRTRFTNNLAVMHTPNLEENQQLEPRIYLTSVEKKAIKITLPPTTVTFLREIAPEEIPTDSLKWGPS